LDYPIVNVGHADLVHTQTDEWWMVMLASRPYGGYYRNLGRETFLAPVVWEDGWPVVSPGTGRVEFNYPVPDLPAHPWPTRPACDQFGSPMLDLCWNFLRTPRDDFWSLTERPGYLRLRLRPQKISEWSNPSFVGRRQQHISFSARTVMEFTPQSNYEEAGIVLLQNNDFQFRMVVGLQGSSAVIRLIQRAKGHDEFLAEQPLASSSRVYFKVEAVEQGYSFYYAVAAEQWQPLSKRADGRILSSDVAGGFVGAYIGMYATSNGQLSDNVADFDWFEYVGI
jgi:alpha-N-arabinofuranosidase